MRRICTGKHKLMILCGIVALIVCSVGMSVGIFFMGRFNVPQGSITGETVRYCYERYGSLHLEYRAPMTLDDGSSGLGIILCGKVLNCETSPCYNSKPEIGQKYYCVKHRYSNWYYIYNYRHVDPVWSLLILFSGVLGLGAFTILREAINKQSKSAEYRSTETLDEDIQLDDLTGNEAHSDLE